MPSLAPYAIYFKAAAIVALVAMGAGGGWWVTSTYYALKISEMEKQQALKIIIAQKNAADTTEKAHAITDRVNAEASAERERQLRNTIANLQRIATHVTPETDRAFPLPCGFIRLHDAAARAIDAAAVSIPAGKTDGERCEIAASTAAGIIQRNYDLALGWKTELDSWWRWYGQQLANWESYRHKSIE